MSDSPKTPRSKHETFSIRLNKNRWSQTCKTCGKATNRTMDDECVDCHLSSNLPSRVSDVPWVWAVDFGRVWRTPTLKRDSETIEIAGAVVNGRFEIRDDGQTLRLLLKNRHYEVPLTMEALDSLAQRTGITMGKWLVWRARADIDDAWKLIAKGCFEHTLGADAKVSTASEASSEVRHVICVYTRNYLDVEDVKRVRGLLRDMGFAERLCYKPDIYTYLNIYSGTTKLSPCRYRE